MNLENEPLVSIVIPTFNRKNTILRTINSVESQTYKNIEIIVVDDGSTDNTRKVLENAKITNLKYIYQENKGACSARNEGTRHSSGSYLIYLDSDDILLPNCIEKVVNYFTVHDHIQAVYWLIGVETSSGRIKLLNKYKLFGNIYKEVLKQGYLTSSSFICISRRLVENGICWDESFPASQDDDFCFKISKNATIGLIDEILGIYKYDGGNTISENKKRVADGWYQLWKKYETDVVEYCGIKTAVSHYEDCLIRYYIINDHKMSEECKKQIKALTSKISYLISVCKCIILAILHKCYWKLKNMKRK